QLSSPYGRGPAIPPAVVRRVRGLPERFGRRPCGYERPCAQVPCARSRCRRSAAVPPPAPPAPPCPRSSFRPRVRAPVVSVSRSWAHHLLSWWSEFSNPSLVHLVIRWSTRLVRMVLILPLSCASRRGWHDESRD